MTPVIVAETVAGVRARWASAKQIQEAPETMFSPTVVATS